MKKIFVSILISLTYILEPLSAQVDRAFVGRNFATPDHLGMLNVDDLDGISLGMAINPFPTLPLAFYLDCDFGEYARRKYFFDGHRDATIVSRYGTYTLGLMIRPYIYKRKVVPFVKPHIGQAGLTTFFDIHGPDEIGEYLLLDSRQLVRNTGLLLGNEIGAKLILVDNEESTIIFWFSYTYRKTTRNMKYVVAHEADFHTPPEDYTRETKVLDSLHLDSPGVLPVYGNRFEYHFFRFGFKVRI